MKTCASCGYVDKLSKHKTCPHCGEASWKADSKAKKAPAKVDSKPKESKPRASKTKARRRVKKVEE